MYFALGCTVHMKVVFFFPSFFLFSILSFSPFFLCFSSLFRVQVIMQITRAVAYFQVTCDLLFLFHALRCFFEKGFRDTCQCLCR